MYSCPMQRIGHAKRTRETGVSLYSVAAVMKFKLKWEKTAHTKHSNDILSLLNEKLSFWRGNNQPNVKTPLRAS